MNKQSLFKLFLISLILILVKSLDTIALNPEKQITQYVYDSWTIKEGLPHNWIDDIVQTKDGYLWIATSIGLVRFDGVKFTIFDKSNTKELNSKHITRLCAGSDGSLWIGTLGGGVSQFKDGNFITYTIENGLVHNFVLNLFETQDKSIWISTEGGLSHLKNGNFTNYTIDNGLRHNKVWAIVQDKEGTIWIDEEGFDNSLLLFKESSFSIYDLHNRNLHGSLYAGRDGEIWIPTTVELLKYQDGKLFSYPVRELKNSVIRDIISDKDGNLWIAADGIHRFRDGKIDSFTISDGLSINDPFVLYEDQEGSIWIGHHTAGLARIKDGKFTSYTTKEGLLSNYINTTYEDRSGRLWINAGGLAELKDNEWEYHSLQKGLSDRSIITIAETADGTMWLGAETSRALYRYKDGQFSRFPLAQPLTNKIIYVLFTDKDNGLWIGTTDGLGRLKDNKLNIYTISQGLSSSNIRAIIEDKQNNVWIGTLDNGLNIINKEETTNSISKQLLGQSISSLYCDKEGTVWIGTNGSGLYRYRDGHFTNYRTKDGLSDDVTFTILEDDRENLWMGSEKGVYRVSKKSLDEFDAGRVKTIESISYGIEDGMVSSSVTGVNQPTACKTKDGRLWFPTIKGLVVIDPNKMMDNLVVPPVHIETAKIDGKIADLKERVVIPKEAMELSISYTATSLLIPKKVKFKYRLEGFDKDWVEAEGRREAHYTNLPYGNYRFKVIASNNDGLWNEVGAELNIYKRPFFYQTYWFYILCILLIGLLGWTLYYLRMVQMKSRFSAILDERNRIAREIHDTLIQGMIGTSAQLDAISMMLFTSPLAAKQHLDQLRIMVRQSIDEARRSVWNIRHLDNESGNLGNLLLDFAKEAIKDREIDIDLQMQGQFRSISPELEKNIVRIGQEAIINSIKHANAAHIIIALSYSQQYLRLCIRDDGCGFDVDKERESTDHFGLLGMQERAKAIKGQLTINSSPGIGTEIILVASLT
jgi:ligand-binding sensor domain-containing protein